MKNKSPINQLILLDVFIAQNRIKKQSLALLLNIKPSQISSYIKNNYFIVIDQFNHCELVKMHKSFDLSDLSLS